MDGLEGAAPSRDPLITCPVFVGVFVGSFGE